MTSPHLVGGPVVKGERSESVGHEVPLTPAPETTLLDQPGEAENPTTQEGEFDGEDVVHRQGDGGDVEPEP
jgi:hypothetical protein